MNVSCRFNHVLLAEAMNRPDIADISQQERLRSYQNDPAPLVAAEAQFVFPPNTVE
jgi:hypothetical protein